MQSILLSLVMAWVQGPAPGDWPGQVTVWPGPGDVLQLRITVQLPGRTPYRAGTPELTMYHEGYVEGFADTIRIRLL
jgi:hypothetical protein